MGAWKDKSPGLKILWLWTFSTAAVLVANVLTTKNRGMEHQTEPQATIHSGDNASSDSPQIISDEKL